MLIKRSWLVGCVVGLAACSGSNVTVTASDGGASSTAPTQGGAVVPAGTCRFNMRATDGAGAPRSGKASARMNGSGNVIVSCTDLAEGREALELWVGNGTYDGPRTYVLASDHADGNAKLETAPDVTYEPTASVASGCKVSIVGPPEQALPAGAVLRGTFSCENLAAKTGGSELDISDGDFSAVVR